MVSAAERERLVRMQQKSWGIEQLAQMLGVNALQQHQATGAAERAAESRAYRRTLGDCGEDGGEEVITNVLGDVTVVPQQRVTRRIWPVVLASVLAGGALPLAGLGVAALTGILSREEASPDPGASQPGTSVPPRDGRYRQPQLRLLRESDLQRQGE